MGRLGLAALAFAFHAPGLRVFAGYRLRPPILRLNIVAVVLTLVAMALAASLSERHLLAVFIAWVTCHFLWSICLAWLVLTQRAGPRSVSPRSHAARAHRA